MRRFGTQTAPIGMLSLVIIGFTACGSGPGASDSLFQSASPEIKTGWNEARAAMKTNGYAAAILKLREVRLTGKLTPQQTEALDKYSDTLRDAMNDAATKGDANAQESAEVVKKVLAR